MSTQTEITRIQTARNKLRTKGVELGINTNTDKLDVIATAYEGIENRGAVSAQVQEGDTYTIPKGYHNGSGTVSGVAGGGNYNLQSKKATPTKKQQNITPDSGYYGLSDVTVDPIPDNFQDVSPVTAGAGDVLATKVIVNAAGETVAGTMPNNGTVTTDALDAGDSYTIPKGYHSGSGKISAKDLASQTPGDAAAGNILFGKKAWVAGVQVVGSMTNNGAKALTIDGLTATSVAIPAGYHNGSGTVSLTSDIEEALAAI